MKDPENQGQETCVFVLNVPHHWGGRGWEALLLLKNCRIENITALVFTCIHIVI